jgi:hypothetical protein
MFNRRKSLFDSLFGDDFTNSFFSFRSMDFSMSEMGTGGFPEEGGPNFHKTEENVETESHIIKKETWVSVDGTQRFERTSSKSKTSPKSLSEPSIEQLKLDMKSAVDSQQFEKAAEIRDKIKELEKGSK